MEYLYSHAPLSRIVVIAARMEDRAPRPISPLYDRYGINEEPLVHAELRLRGRKSSYLAKFWPYLLYGEFILAGRRTTSWRAERVASFDRSPSFCYATALCETRGETITRDTRGVLYVCIQKKNFYSEMQV